MKDSGNAPFKKTPYTNTGRALTKKLGRPQEAPAWEHLRPKITNESGYNEAAQKFLDDLFNNPEMTYSVERGRIGGVHHDLHSLRLGSGLGARFDMDGNFVGFVT